MTVELVRSASAFRERSAQDPSPSVESDLGGYSRKTRTIVVNLAPGLPTISHELVHPLIQSDFVMAPAWLDEGIASLFEKPVFEPPGEMHGASNWRYERLARAVRSDAERGEVHLPALFALTDFQMVSDRRDLYYAEARAFCQWLDERGQLWLFYRAWRDGVGADLRGEKSFAQVTGTTPAEADAAWVAWVKGLR